MHDDSSLDAELVERFGYHSFRPGQREIIEAALAGRDVLAIMPTGGGKSLTFQLPALLGEGVTIVISPLIALMKDQVDRLARRSPGAATFLNSSVSGQQARKRLERAVAGSVRLLYRAPGRLRSIWRGPLFFRSVKSRKWSTRIPAARVTASNGWIVPSVHNSRINRS